MPRWSRCTCWRRCWTRATAWPGRSWRRSASTCRSCKSRCRPSSTAGRRSAAARSRIPNRQLMAVLEAAMKEAAAMKDEFVSVEHLLLALTKNDSPAKNLLQVNGVRDKDILEALEIRPRSAPRHRPEPRRPVSGPAKIRHRPGAKGHGRQARSGHRPRPGNPPRDSGPLAAHEEQPRADRRAGRRQDGDRRRARPADRPGRRAADR